VQDVRHVNRLIILLMVSNVLCALRLILTAMTVTIKDNVLCANSVSLLMEVTGARNNLTVRLVIVMFVINRMLISA